MRGRYRLYVDGIIVHGCPSGGDSISIRGPFGGYPLVRDESACDVGDAVAPIEAAPGVRPGS
jgi:hypothetical protein